MRGTPISHQDRGRRRAQTWLFVLAFLFLAVGGTAGALLARSAAVRDADERAGTAAERAAMALEVEVQAAAASLSGAAAVVDPSGRLDTAAFERFGSGLVGSGEAEGVLLIGRVTAGERSAFEATLGRPISVVGADGELGRAPDAAVLYPVQAVVPDLADRSAIGLDFGADQARRAALDAAQGAREPVVTAAVVLVASGEEGFGLVRPLFDGDAPIGFVAIGLPAADLQASLRLAVGDGAAVGLLDDGAVALGAELAGDDIDARAEVEVAGRDWEVVVEATDGPDLALSRVVAGGVVAALAALAVLVWVTTRHQRQMADANARLRDGEVRGTAVQQVAGQLARALSGDDVVSALVDQLPVAVGARSVVVATIAVPGQLDVLGELEEEGYERALPSERWGPVIDLALRDGRPSWLQSPLLWRDDAGADWLARGGWALAVLPLAGEEVRGVLAVAYPRVHVFEEGEQALLQTVGVMASRALARGRRYDAEHEAAVAFQRTALPGALPVVDGLTIAARYRPAEHQATVGGDWYDVLVLAERRVLLVVGDVVGHDMEAAAAMGRLRTAFQAIAPLRPDPGDMVRAIGQQVATIPGALCTTVVCVVVDLDERTMTWCRAGHPPPLVVGRQGATTLDGVGMPPLGVSAGAEAVVHCRGVIEGETVVLYTDGVIERRGEPIDHGLRRIEVVAAALADLEPDDFSDALVEAMVPSEEQSDDVVVLAVRVDVSPPC